MIDSITMIYVINKTTGTISLTTDKYNTVLSHIAFLHYVTIAINKYLNQSNNPITEFQLASIATDICLDMVPPIAIPNDTKDLIRVIKKQVHFAEKVEVVQTWYLMLDLLKRYWKENSTP